MIGLQLDDANFASLTRRGPRNLLENLYIYTGYKIMPLDDPVHSYVGDMEQGTSVYVL